MKTLAHISTAFLLTGLVLVGCGDKDDDTGPTDTDSAGSEVNCVTCPDGYEIDVVYPDCTGSSALIGMFVAIRLGSVRGCPKCSEHACFKLTPDG